MSKRDALMLALYLVVIVMGVAMLEHQPTLGFVQIFFGAAMFGFRLWWSTNRHIHR